MKKCNFYYYSKQQQVLELKVDKAGDYYLVIDHYSKQAQLIDKNQAHTRVDIKQEKPDKTLL